MPRPGPRRAPVVVRLSAEGHDHLQMLADAETGGNKSEMIRRLMTEALAARERKKSRPN